MVFHSAPYGAFGHGHADQNSFHIIAYDEDLLIDSGYFTPAGDPHRQQWSIRTPAHNTLLVDGEGRSVTCGSLSRSASRSCAARA
jgi:hypothetical protein